jgi:hypothetical protein
MAARRKKEYAIRFHTVPLNGRAGKADVFVVEKETQKEILAGRINPQDHVERRNLAKEWAKKLRCKPEKLESAINEQWCEEIAKAREQQATEEDEPKERWTQSQVILQLATDAAEFFHAPDLVAYACASAGHHKGHEALPVRGQLFRSWLSKRYYDFCGKAPGSQTTQDVINVLEAKARYDGPTVPVHVRIADNGSGVSIDLGDETHRVIEVSASTWLTRDSSNLMFRRPRGLLPLPEPRRGGSILDLKPFVNVVTEDWILIVAWVLSTMWPRGPKPVLFLQGEQGSAKTTTARIVRSIVDPHVLAVRRPPRDEHDLAVGANNSWGLAFDNLSLIRTWLSDALCCLSTGGGFGTRELYSDTEEAIFAVQRPVVATGIDQLPTRNDLLDRSVIVECEVIDDEDRIPESHFYAEFGQKWPFILGAFLDLLCGALRELPKVEIKGLPRMADFALLAVAGMRALGLRDSDFLDPYLANQARAFGFSLDRCPVVQPLYDLLATYPDGSWEGTVMELFTALNGGEPGGNTGNNPDSDGQPPPSCKKKGWPKSPKALSNLLRRIAPALRRETRAGRPRLNITWLQHTNRGNAVRMEIIRTSQAME